MDDNSNSQELIQFRSEIVKLNGANLMKSNDARETPELTQYINIHRVGLPDSIGKEYADCHSPASSELMSHQMIQHHVVHGGMVVDMMVPQGSVPTDYSQHHLERTSLPQYIPEHYDNTEDLLSDHLTDEDRRLAAALVAVQLSQQQKHQLNHHVESNVIVSTGSMSRMINKVSEHHHMTTLSPLSPNTQEKPGMAAAAMVSSYIQAVEEEAAASSVHHLLPVRTDHHQGERIMKMYQPQHQETRLPPLPPLKKVLSNHSMGIRHQYLRQMPDVSRQDAESILEMDSRLHHQVMLDEEQEHDMHAEANLIKEEVQYVVKNEGLGLYYEENGDTMNKNDSDYEVENERSSRRSLPHKKRIPRKLKNIKTVPPPKSVSNKSYKCNKCGEQCESPAALASHRSIHHNTTTAAKKLFNCEICTRVLPNQLKFFEHLKSHYEPVMSGATNGTETESVKIVKDTKVIKDIIPIMKIEPNTVKAVLPTFSCIHCGKVFRRQKAFESHMNLVHPRTEEIEFSEPEDLMEGIREVVRGVESGDEADMDVMVAPVTPRSLKHVDDKEWYPDEELHAAEVDIQELEEQHQQQQQQQHDTEQEENTCQFCGDLFEDKDQVQQHVHEVHMELQEEMKDENVSPTPKGRRAGTGKRQKKGGAHLSCPQCNRLFNHRNSLVYHLRSHSGERPHQCEVCGKSFFAASALKVHMRLHSGDKPYKCEFCGRHFRQWGDLKYHCISIHSEEKNYQCEYCGKDFARKYSLIVHRRIHTGEKNYKCEFCEKSFRASSYLQNHRRIHTGEKPHPCEVCGKPFRVRSDMKRHLNTHNRDRSNNRVPVQFVESHMILSAEPKLEEQDSEQLSNSMLDHHSMSDHNSEMSARNEGSRGETILPDEHLNESSTDQEPINLNIAVPNISTRQLHQLSPTAEVSEEVLQYSRDPLELVREGNNTLYVWPVFMT